MNDIIIDTDWDLAIINGDLLMDDDKVQRQRLIVGTAPNDWKQDPRMGLDAERYLDDEDLQSLNAGIREQFRMDGMLATNITIENNEILINVSSAQ